MLVSFDALAQQFAGYTDVKGKIRREVQGGRLVQVNDLREEVGDEPVTMKIKYMDDRNDRILTAKFVVSGEDADMAYDAAKGRRTVSLTGVLTGPPRSRSLEQISDFKVLD